MKAPKYVVLSLQDCINIGINAFALKLLAESFADDPAKFGDDNILFRLEAHNGQDVWMLVTKTMPNLADFEDAPPGIDPL